MSMQRPILWIAALRDIHSDRTRVAPGVVSARSLIQGLNRIRRTCLITPTGAFDRAAIMAAAVEAAKAHQLRTGAAWSASMSVGLTAAWQAAKANCLTALAHERELADRTKEASRRVNSQPPRAGREERGVNYSGASSPLSPSPLTHLPLGPFTRDFPGASASPISAPR